MGSRQSSSRAPRFRIPCRMSKHYRSWRSRLSKFLPMPCCRADLVSWKRSVKRRSLLVLLMGSVPVGTSTQMKQVERLTLRQYLQSHCPQNSNNRWRGVRYQVHHFSRELFESAKPLASLWISGHLDATLLDRFIHMPWLDYHNISLSNLNPMVDGEHVPSLASPYVMMRNSSIASR